MKLTTKQIATTALLLAICIMSQFFKNLNVYITGPVINAALILAVLYCGLGCGIILAVITPVTAFLITGSPVMSAIPAIIPCIIAGNIILVLAVSRFQKLVKKPYGFPIGIIVGAVLKAAFMGAVISYWILPAYLPDKMQKMLPALQTQFSVTQLLTALIGGAYASIIAIALKSAFGVNGTQEV